MADILDFEIESHVAIVRFWVASTINVILIILAI